MSLMLQAIARGSCRPIRPSHSWRIGICQLTRTFASRSNGLSKGKPARPRLTTGIPGQRQPSAKTKIPTTNATSEGRPNLSKPLPNQALDKSTPRREAETSAGAPVTQTQSAPIPPVRTVEKFVYPERLLIYHAGTGRTVFLSFIKLSGIFLIIFTGLFVAPAYYFSPLEPTYLAFVYLAGSCIPLAIMTFTAPPFVTYVHLKLPVWARHSAARLQRYTQALPSTSELDVTSLKWIWPRVTRLSAGELYLHQGQLSGAMTLRREVPRHVLDSRKWFAWRPIKKFYVGGKAGKKSAEPWVWEGVIAAVARGYPKARTERRLGR